ncbi:MAG: response regulator [Thermodesulfobacteriota bacterium]
MKRVLVVDDEKALGRLLAHALAMEGYVADTADDGVKALRHLEQHACDLLITDYNMPEMDGLELTRQVRSRFPSVPILVVTGDGPLDVLMKSGATACVEKPVPLDKLLGLVKNILA